MGGAGCCPLLLLLLLGVGPPRVGAQEGAEGLQVGGTGWGWRVGGRRTAVGTNMRASETALAMSYLDVQYNVLALRRYVKLRLLVPVHAGGPPCPGLPRCPLGSAARAATPRLPIRIRTWVQRTRPTSQHLSGEPEDTINLAAQPNLLFSPPPPASLLSILARGASWYDRPSAAAAKAGPSAARASAWRR